MKKILNVICFFIGLSISTLSATLPPKLTVVFVVDGIEHHVIQKLRPFFKSGLKELLDKGIVYENAYHPHARPTTATGHAALATGAFADIHGIIANSWLLADGTKVAAVEDYNENMAELNDLHEGDKEGKSAHRIMVEGISDQLMLSSQPQKPYLAYALSFKDRAAIPLAGKLGKAIWFNYYSGKFTSGKAYFDTLPEWLVQLNKKIPSTTKRSVRWKRAFPHMSNAYNFRYIHDYRYTTSERLVGTHIPVSDTSLTEKKYKLFTCCPAGQNMLFTCAQRCLDDVLQKHQHHAILLWISISSPAKIGHWFGPDGLEYIDLIYHLDQQLGHFMNYAKKKVGADNAAFIFTADHGSMPIIELLQEQGISTARRINIGQMTKNINEYLSHTYKLEKDIILAIKPPQVYCDEPYLNNLSSEMKQKIIKKIQKLLLSQPGIRRVWTREKRTTICEPLPSHLAYYKHQSYPGRDGLLTMQVEPYSYFAKYPSGTGHGTPYEYDTHVPFIMYQQGKLQRKKIHNRVWTLQLAPTLAYMFDIPKPSGTTFEMLPEIT